jgi:predicted phage-related endonuclease
MSRTDINETVKTIRELKRMKEELEAEIQAEEDLIKAEMNRTSNYTILGDDYKVTWNEVTSTRVDTTALKKALPDVVEKFTKTTTTRRFCIA